MIDIIESLKKKETFFTSKGASAQQIKEAENELGLQFAKDYVRYVSAFGIASYANHELTGICQSERLNVVAVTRHCRDLINTVGNNWYVIEQTNMDGVLVWQNEDGTIIQTSLGNEPVILCHSLTEYINL